MICCNGSGCGNENGSCFWNGCVGDVLGFGCCGGHVRRVSSRVPRRRDVHHSTSRAAYRSGPSEPEVLVHPRSLHPWRPSHLLHPSCRESARMRNLCFLSCIGLEGYKRPRLGRTFQRRASASPAMCDTLNYLPLTKSCLLHQAEVYRNSFYFTPNY